MIPEKEQIDKILDKFEEERAGLGPWTVQKRPNILDMTLDEIRKKTPQELAEQAFEIRRYCLNLTRLKNRIFAWIKWARLKLDEYQAEYLKDAPDYGWQGRMLAARHSGENCKKLNQFLRQLEMESESLRDVDKQIESIASSIDAIRFANYKQDRNS